jgi:hypothetical protein
VTKRGGVEKILGGGEDLRSYLTYVGKSLWFVFGFRVDPRIDR